MTMKEKPSKGTICQGSARHVEGDARDDAPGGLMTIAVIGTRAAWESWAHAPEAPHA